MALTNPFLQSLLDIINDPTTDDANILVRLKGLNLQKGVLALLLSSAESLAIVAGGTVPPPAPTALARSITTETGSTNSPITAGAQSIALIFSKDFVGTVGGAAIDPAQCPSYCETAGKDKTLPVLAYTVTGGSMVKSVLR